MYLFLCSICPQHSSDVTGWRGGLIRRMLVLPLVTFAVPKISPVRLFYSCPFNFAHGTVDDHSFADVTRNIEPAQSVAHANSASTLFSTVLQDQSSIFDATLCISGSCILTFYSALTADEFRNSVVCGPLWDSIVPRDDSFPILRNMSSLTIARYEVAKDFRLFSTIFIARMRKVVWKENLKPSRISRSNSTPQCLRTPLISCTPFFFFIFF